MLLGVTLSSPGDGRPQCLLDTLPRQFVPALDGLQDQPVAGGKLVPPHDVDGCARADVARAVVRHRARSFVNRVGAKISGVSRDSGLGLIRRGFLAGVLRARSIGHDLHGHVPSVVIVNQPGGVRTAAGIGLAV